ncbi:NADH dehydrogenase (quinone), G subunit [beta proteobacterium KB13]|uniref:NADH-quinone oxidoreductase n=1 Tax=beta proteobacterium KB13 TaxID=314607 RepID=B6BWX6_9PROT|nr:NADH dehydrogenase (quinone), G subunit [beta proteobacterium KB13]
MVKIKINGKTFKAPEKSTIIQVADDNGIEIPRFCYHKKLSIAANCRMCLVEVKNFPKPLPACATQVNEGMEIFTKSKQTKDCQQSVMEFLLINHPLDCPICDQGGECDLQDTAMAYGSPKSRYQEEKRVVLNKNLGPLVSTDLNRCIQCSRCVRFLKEVGGMQELGLIGRGEHAEISAYVEKSVDSEISGNIIDLCPVGALTSKPFRYSARTWEMVRKSTISPHDSLGSHLEAHVKDGNVMRVLPKENEDINECWISDRDRFSYIGINSEDRIKTPLLKTGSNFKPISWDEAFHTLERVFHPSLNKFKEDEVAIFSSNQITLEEAYLLDKLASYVGTKQVKFDVANNPNLIANPSLNGMIGDVESFENIILLGSQLRNENPLLLQRLRKMGNAGKTINIINTVDFDLQLTVSNKIIQPIKDFQKTFEHIHKILSTKVAKKENSTEKNIANLLSEKTLLLVGEDIYTNPAFMNLTNVINQLIDLTSMKIGCLPTGSNSVGLQQMFGNYVNHIDDKKYQASISLNLELEDIKDKSLFERVLKKSKFNVGVTPFLNKNSKQFDLILPSTTHFENEGTFVNLESRVQSFSQTISPKFESKPLWKILRVLGNFIDCPDFTFESCSEIKEKAVQKLSKNKLKRFNLINQQVKHHSKDFWLKDINNSDALVRRSTALQNTKRLRSEK